MSSVANLRLGYENGKVVKARSSLKPVGSKAKVEENTDFYIPPVPSFNKHTDHGGYNSLTDPYLKEFFKKPIYRKIVTQQGLATDDLMVLETTKKSHERRYMETLSRAKIEELEDEKRQSIVRRSKAKASAESARRTALKTFRKAQEEEKRSHALLLKKVSVNRRSVKDTKPTERDREYIEANNEKADIRAQMAAIKKIQIDAKTRFKAAKIAQRLKEEERLRKQALEERKEADAAALAAVQDTILKNKATQKATRERIERSQKKRQEQVKKESQEFRESMQKTFDERALQQQLEIAERARKRAEEEKVASEVRAKREREKLRKQQEDEARRQAELTKLRAEQYRQEQIRKREEQERKEASRIAKEKRAKELQEQAEANRLAVAAEKEHMKQLETERLHAIEQAKEEKRLKNVELNKAREAAIALANKEKEDRRRRELEMDAKTQAAIKKANAEAYKQEQKLLWEKAMQEAEREEAEMQRQKHAEIKRRKAAEEETRKLEKAEQLRQKKAAADKMKAQKQIQETMIKMKAEVDRQIKNLEKGY